MRKKSELEHPLGPLCILTPPTPFVSCTKSLNFSKSLFIPPKHSSDMNSSASLTLTEEVQPYYCGSKLSEGKRLLHGLSLYAQMWIGVQNDTDLPKKYRLAMYVRARRTSAWLSPKMLAAKSTTLEHNELMRVVLEDFTRWKSTVDTSDLIEKVREYDEFHEHDDWVQCGTQSPSMVQLFLALTDGAMMSFPAFVELTQLTNERIFTKPEHSHKKRRI